MTPPIRVPGIVSTDDPPGAVLPSETDRPPRLIDAGPANAGRAYILLGGVSGTSPRSAFSLVTMPLNWDALTDLILQYLNAPVFANFHGQRNANGQAVAQLNSTPFTGLAGTTVYLAFVTYGPIDYTSTPMVITITP